MQISSIPKSGPEIPVNIISGFKVKIFSFNFIFLSIYVNSFNKNNLFFILNLKFVFLQIIEYAGSSAKINKKISFSLIDN